MSERSTPLLLWDGECGFCRKWIARARRVIGDRIEWATYQEAVARVPEVSSEQCARAVHLIERGPGSDVRVSRAAEAVYPFAVAYKYGHDVKYAASAVRLGNWLVGIQNASGAWIEEWPATSGWDGTSADQLISLAGAYAILGARLSAAVRFG